MSEDETPTQPPGSGRASPDPLAAFGSGVGSQLPPVPPEPAAVEPPPLPPPPPIPPAPPTVPPPPERYPMRFEVEYPERLSRVATFFRGLLIIPALVFYLLVSNIPSSVLFGARAGTFLKRKYPTWLFAAGSGFFAWSARFGAYGLLLTDHYPSFSAEAGPVVLEYDEPPQGQMSRWRGILWRVMLLIPHFIVLNFLWLAVLVVSILAWFAILFTGRYPRGLFGFTSGVMRWGYRVQGYLFLFNDRFPPFALSETAGPASTASAVICGTIGGLIVGGLGSLIGVGIALGNNPHTEHASYASLKAGRGAVTVSYGGGLGDIRYVVTLARVYDPGESQVQILAIPKGSRAVIVEWNVGNNTGGGAEIKSRSATLKVARGAGTRSLDAELMTVGGEVAPADVDAHSGETVRALFVIASDEQPVSLRFYPTFGSLAGLKYVFD